LSRAGLNQRDLDCPPARICAAAQARFLEYAADAVDDKAFGLHLAEQANLKELGLIFYITSAAKNLGQALELFTRYRPISNESVRFKVARERDGVMVEIVYVGISQQCVKQNAEFWMAAIVKFARDNTGCDVRPTRVAHAHVRTGDLREFERFYGCPVEFGAPTGQLGFSNETLALPLITADTNLLETLRPVCEQAAVAHSKVIASLRASVENEIQRLLPEGRCNIKTVAKALAVSVRTLSRRLSAEGTTFFEVVDQLRNRLACEYLKDQKSSLAEIAWLLGYEGVSSFNHAFKRWTGRSPSSARGERQLEPLA
jgi:AraC-like DNA-binding protein